MKKIVTHINPDLDAVAAVWLLKRFLPASPAGGPGWEEATVGFAGASASTEKDPKADENPDELWVDIGRGKLDHHHTGEYLSATKLCFDFVSQEREGQPLAELDKKALIALVEVVTQVDNARDMNWEEVLLPRYYFQLHTLLDGLRGLEETDEEVVEFGFRALDAVFWNLKNRIRATEELAEGTEFITPWGKAIAVESGNKHVLWQGEALGYVLVVKKDPELGGIRIYARPDSKVDLTAAYHQFKKEDPESDWFLHATKRLLLNQSSVNPEMQPTTLSLPRVIEILQKKS